MNLEELYGVSLTKSNTISSSEPMNNNGDSIWWNILFYRNEWYTKIIYSNFAKNKAIYGDVMSLDIYHIH